MRRFQARRSSGRFTGNTMENTFGLHAGVHGRKTDGSWCGSFNPSRVGEPRPTHCHACGEALAEEPEAAAKPEAEERKP
jgi:hypothetical protein